jgi:hypothetical protein
MADLHADDGALAAIAKGLLAAAESVGALAGSVPAEPDAGEAAPVVATVLANLLVGAGELTEAAAAMATGVQESATAYRAAETRTRDGLRAVLS